MRSGTLLACVLTVLVVRGTAQAAAATEAFALGLAALSVRDFAAAEQRFRAVIAADPRAYEAYNNLAVACAEQGEDEAAAAALQAAVRLRPGYERARQNLGAIYVRLAVKQLLAAAELADGAQRQSLAAAARALLAAGPHLAPGELLAQAERLAASATAVGNTSPASVASPSPSPSATATPATPGMVHGTATPSAVAVVPILIEPVGGRMLLIDPKTLRGQLYRREAQRLIMEGEWPLTIRGRIGSGVMFDVSRRSPWSVRLRDAVTDGSASWLIESAAKSTKAVDAVVLAATDFRAASGSLEPSRAHVVVYPNVAGVVLAEDRGAQLRQRLEAWRAAWSSGSLEAYSAFYAPAFVDDEGRSEAAWAERKRAIFEHSGKIDVGVREVVVNVADDLGETVFDQSYASGLERSQSRKRLTWRQQGGVWLIAAETIAAEEIKQPSGSRESAE
ncbi:MAG: tetratricopeptide repeat protein [Micromonosporaceae bacterium]